MPIELDTLSAVRLAAMDLLARREHGRQELVRKLRKRGAPEELINTALDRLAEEGLLSETRYLSSYIASRARAGYGPMRIREELGQRGLARSDIEQALSECEENWAEHLREVWQRKFKGKRPEDAKQKAQQGRFLSYRGFSMDSISRLLRGVPEDE
jgi:regulatory protein